MQNTAEQHPDLTRFITTLEAMEAASKNKFIKYLVITREKLAAVALGSLNYMLRTEPMEDAEKETEKFEDLQAARIDLLNMALCELRACMIQFKIQGDIDDLLSLMVKDSFDFVTIFTQNNTQNNSQNNNQTTLQNNTQNTTQITTQNTNQITTQNTNQITTQNNTQNKNQNSSKQRRKIIRSKQIIPSKQIHLDPNVNTHLQSLTTPINTTSSPSPNTHKTQPINNTSSNISTHKTQPINNTSSNISTHKSNAFKKQVNIPLFRRSKVKKFKFRLPFRKSRFRSVDEPLMSLYRKRRPKNYAKYQKQNNILWEEIQIQQLSLMTEIPEVEIVKILVSKKWNEICNESCLVEAMEKLKML